MSEEEKKAIENLKEYIKEDDIYNGTRENLSDFDGFCIEHCTDIVIALGLIKKQQIELEKKNKIIDEMAEIIGEYIHEVNAGDEICKYQKEEFCKNSRMMNLNLCIYCIEQYFERKLKNGN